MSTAIIRGQKIEKEKLKRSKELRSRMTAAEKALWEHLRANRLGGLHFRRQQVIEGFIADFYCHKAQLVIEVDGGIHDVLQDRDQERNQIMTKKGLIVLRIKNQAILENLPAVLEKIAKACNSGEE